MAEDCTSLAQKSACVIEAGADLKRKGDYNEGLLHPLPAGSTTMITECYNPGTGLNAERGKGDATKSCNIEEGSRKTESC